MTQSLLEFLSPYFLEKGLMAAVGFLDKCMYAVSLSPLPETEVLRTYTDGDCMMQSTYTLKLRVPFGTAGENDAEILFSALAGFLRACNSENTFPELPEGNFAVSLSCTLPEKAESITANSAVFSAKIHITHYSIHKKGLITC